ncbi:MAG: hypothetical protein QW228_01055 [Candidatus Aenigmatarchaeota archaeon]
MNDLISLLKTSYLHADISTLPDTELQSLYSKLVKASQLTPNNVLVSKMLDKVNMEIAKRVPQDNSSEGGVL